MSYTNQFNFKSPAVKRLMREAKELAEPLEDFWAYPLDDNLFEWHFTVKGPQGTDFEGGFYHGRIIFPADYPMKPPNIIMLTPNGRFETNKKICLSISGFHPETWQPSWSIRTALVALIAFMPTPALGTIGSLEYSPEERQVLARKSTSWECSSCGKINNTCTNDSKDKSNHSSVNDGIDPIFRNGFGKSDIYLTSNVTSENLQQLQGIQNHPITYTDNSSNNNIQMGNMMIKDILILILIASISLLVFRRLYF